MSLRNKCALLLVAFELTLAATLLSTVRYIGTYFEDAAETLAVSNRTGADLARLKALVREELNLAREGAGSESVRERLDREIGNAVGRLDANSGALGAASLMQLRQLVRQRAEDGSIAGHLALYNYLVDLEMRVMNAVRSLVETSVQAQQRAALILAVNMLVAAVLGVAGMVLVRRWVLLPVQELKHATDQYARGRLEHKARVLSGDELGQLATAMNTMSAELAQNQRQKVVRERLAAMGELVSYVAHNIRNPLAGIRSLAESCLRRMPADAPLRREHEEIVVAIERMQRWMRELEHSCKPLEIEPGEVAIDELIDNVIAVFRPMAERRRIDLCRNGDGRGRSVCVDERHFEQAVAAVVGNAIEAAGERGRVTIGFQVRDDSDGWSLYVSDSGKGVPAELRQRIFHPTFSTKREGQGLGLTMARKIAELHGGQLELESPASGGALFRFTLPERPALKAPHA
jgi:signal transduction histidine kinase